MNLSKDLEQKARVLNLAGDPTRIRILCFLFDQSQACVSDIAQELDMSVAAVSHHLQLLKEGELLSTERQGQNICYSVNTSQATKQLEQFICECA